jgi:hypothetical protein
MSFHSPSSKDDEESCASKGLQHDLDAISEILKKRYSPPRKSWFGYEKDKQDLERRMSNFNVGSEGDIKNEHKMEIEEK